MKKYLITLFILLASLTSIYALNEFFNSNISMDELTQINIYCKDKLKETYNLEKDEYENYNADYTNLINAINGMEKIDLVTNYNSNYKIDIITDDELLFYTFYIDLKELKLYASYEDEVYIISEDMTKELFNSTFFDEIYYEDILLSSKFKLKNNSISSSVNGEIIYTTPYEFENKKQISYSSEDNLFTVNDFENNHTVRLSFAAIPSKVVVETYKDELLVSERIVNNNEFDLLKREGITSYKVITSWKNNDELNFNGHVSYEFDIDMDLSPEFELVANNKGAGEFFLIKALYFNDDEKPVIKSDSIRNKHFEKIGDEYLLIIPLNYYQKQARYNIDLYVKKGLEDTLIDSKELIIENRKFTSQRLTINKTTIAATSTDNAYTEFAKYFTPSRENSNPKAYFTDSFMLPIDGRISTQFGMMRYVNGSLTSYRHSGIDIAVPRGTPVPATNTGKIVLSRELILTGNTIVIDHGVGIFSVYYHMDTLNVSKEDMVKKAEIIGTVGSTGRSTGPHLHFTTSFYKTNINPNFLIGLSEEELRNIID